MFESPFDAVTVKALVTLLILAAVYRSVSEILAPDVTALLALLALVTAIVRR